MRSWFDKHGLAITLIMGLLIFTGLGLAVASDFTYDAGNTQGWIGFALTIIGGLLLIPIGLGKPNEVENKEKEVKE